jgi:hypothetical protein
MPPNLGRGLLFLPRKTHLGFTEAPENNHPIIEEKDIASGVGAVLRVLLRLWVCVHVCACVWMSVHVGGEVAKHMHCIVTKCEVGGWAGAPQVHVPLCVGQEWVCVHLMRSAAGSAPQ